MDVMKFHFIEMIISPLIGKPENWRQFRGKIKTLQKAFENWEILSRTKEEIVAYRARVEQLFDEKPMIREAEMRGIEKGISLEKRIITKKLIAENMPVETISEITELGLGEVKAIQQTIR